jgi:hypothetical protein
MTWAQCSFPATDIITPDPVNIVADRGLRSLIEVIMAFFKSDAVRYMT